MVSCLLNGMSSLVNNLIRDGYLKTDSIIDAFTKIRRIEFVPDDLENAAEMNIPLPIGFGQTISQPLTVAFMLELLEVETGGVVLDIGSGSGWTTALLCQLVGEKGKVVSLEVIEELCRIGEKNVDKFDFVKKDIAEFHCMDATEGFVKRAPYDRILVSAVVSEVPSALKEQLKIGGKMVIPVNNAICFLEKKSQDDFRTETFAGFSFVPFIVERSE